MEILRPYLIDGIVGIVSLFTYNSLRETARAGDLLAAKLRASSIEFQVNVHTNVNWIDDEDETDTYQDEWNACWKEAIMLERIDFIDWLVEVARISYLPIYSKYAAENGLVESLRRIHFHKLKIWIDDCAVKAAKCGKLETLKLLDSIARVEIDAKLLFMYNDTMLLGVANGAYLDILKWANENFHDSFKIILEGVVGINDLGDEIFCADRLLETAGRSGDVDVLKFMVPLMDEIWPRLEWIKRIAKRGLILRIL